VQGRYRVRLIAHDVGRQITAGIKKGSKRALFICLNFHKTLSGEMAKFIRFAGWCRAMAR
jgi:hypothetical protein